MYGACAAYNTHSLLPHMALYGGITCKVPRDEGTQDEGWEVKAFRRLACLPDTLYSHTSISRPHEQSHRCYIAITYMLSCSKQALMVLSPSV